MTPEEIIIRAVLQARCEARNETLEEAARVADKWAFGEGLSGHKTAAAAIRAIGGTDK